MVYASTKLMVDILIFIKRSSILVLIPWDYETRIFDCFTYFNEDILLEFRLKYLSPLVDIFVVVESSATHSGQSKSFGALNVIQSLSPEIAQKVRLIEVSDYPTANFEMVKGEALGTRTLST